MSKEIFAPDISQQVNELLLVLVIGDGGEDFQSAGLVVLSALRMILPAQLLCFLSINFTECSLYISVLGTMSATDGVIRGFHRSGKSWMECSIASCDGQCLYNRVEPCIFNVFCQTVKC